MQRPWRELSWQAIQAIVGVKLSVDVLRFDDLSSNRHDSDVEIIEDDSDNDSSPLPQPPPHLPLSHLLSPHTPPSPSSSSRLLGTPNHSPTAPSLSGAFPSSEPLSVESIPPRTPTPPPTPPRQDTPKSPPACDDNDNDNSVDNTLSIDEYLEVTLFTDSDSTPPHVCSHCDRTFSTQTELTSHTCSARKPADDKKQHGCHVCVQKFPTYYELRKHINTHFPGMLDSKSSFCHLCQKDYTKTGFMNHLRKHTGERPFVCELCRKAFSQSSSLSIHMKFHLNVRKHVCTVCDKKFVTKSELSRHMTVHTKQKSYYCGVCDKAFTRSDNMKKHEKTHG